MPAPHVQMNLSVELYQSDDFCETQKMTKTDQKWLSRLQALKDELLAVDEDASGGRAAVELDQSRVGRLSRMDALQGQAMNKAIAERRRNRLARIEAALARLDDGEFGFCLKCGDEITEKRLWLDPAVAVCINCSK